MREVKLVEFINQRFAEVLRDSERIVEEAAAEVEKLVKGSRRQAETMRKKIASLDAELDRLASVIVDPDLSDPAVKRLISRQIAEKSTQRDQLQNQIGELLGGANDRAEQIARATRQAFEEARQSLANVASPADYNQFVRDFVGLMTVDADGTIRPRTLGPGAHVAEATCAVGPGRDAVKRGFWRAAA